MNLNSVVIGTREVKSLDGSRRISALNANVRPEPIDVAATGNLAGDADVLPLDDDRGGTGGFGNLEGLEADGIAGFYGFYRRSKLIVGIDSRDAGVGGHRNLSGTGSGRCASDASAEQKQGEGARGEVHLSFTKWAYSPKPREKLIAQR